MSSLTKNDIAKRARERLTDWPEAKVGFTIPRLEANVDSALERLAQIVAQDRKRRRLLRPISSAPFTATLTAGQVDLASSIDSDKILLAHLNEAEIYLADLTINAQPFQWEKSFGQLQLSTISDAMYIHCALQDTLLGTRNVDGSLTSLDGVTINIWANFIPTMTSLSVELEQQLVDVLVQIAITKTIDLPKEA